MRRLIIDVGELWVTAASGGWRPSSAPRSDWPPARIMNATLVLPELDSNSFWHDDSGFHGVYDVEHFIKSLRYDVRIVESIPEIRRNGKTKKIKAFQIRPPRDAPISWYTTDALAKMKDHSRIGWQKKSTTLSTSV